MHSTKREGPKKTDKDKTGKDSKCVEQNDKKFVK